MSLRQVVAAQKEIIRYDWRIITTYRMMRRSYVHAPSVIHPVEWTVVNHAYKQMQWTQRSLHRNLAAIQRQGVSSIKIGDLHAWVCIHNGEGAWNDNTGNGFYGGLQMDYGFMQSYGPELLATKGTADHWTPAEQMTVAERARASGRGYYPWPNTARACGLI